jgi:uncharacterized membrane protein (DUF4010 family)
LVYARHAREQAMSGLAVVVILIANLVVLVRLGVVSGFVSPKILPQLLPVLGSRLLLGMAGAFYWWRRMNGDEAVIMPKIENPTEIKTALSFGTLYAIVLLAAAWFSDVAGQGGLYLLALVSGLTDVDAISLSSLRLFQQGKLLGGQAVTAIAIAYLANLGFKLGLLSFIGGSELARRAAVGMATAALGIVAGLLVFA